MSIAERILDLTVFWGGITLAWRLVVNSHPE
jgi:hypothetical protein